MTAKVAASPRKIIEPTGSLRERFGALAFTAKTPQMPQIVSLFEKILPPEGTAARAYCENHVENYRLRDILTVHETALKYAPEFLGAVTRLPDPLVEALIARSINLDMHEAQLQTSETAKQVDDNILTGWAADGSNHLTEDPLGRIGFFAEGLTLLESYVPEFRFYGLHEDGKALNDIERNVMYPLRMCGKAETEIEKRIYVRMQELAYRVNHSGNSADWYLDEAARFFYPGYEATGNLFAGMGMPDHVLSRVNLAYDFYRSISEDPDYECFIDFTRLSLNPLLLLEQSTPQMTDFMMVSALFCYAVQDPRFYSYCNGKLPDDFMMALKTFNPSDSFETGVSLSARQQFHKAQVAAHTNALATMTRLHSSGMWEVCVSYEDCGFLKDQITAAPTNWADGLDTPLLAHKYRHALKWAVWRYNDIISHTNPEECLERPLVGENDDYDLTPSEKDSAPTVH